MDPCNPHTCPVRAGDSTNAQDPTEENRALESGASHRGTLLSIQCLRGVAACLVVVQHVIGGFHLKYPLQSGWLFSAGYLADLGASGVDIFFVISGFVMVYVSRFNFGRNATIGDFLVRRIIRIVPLYWLASLLMLLLLLFLPSLFSTMKFDLSFAVKSFLFIPTVNTMGDYYPIVSVGWTLSYEMYFYIVFAALLVFSAPISIALAGIVFVSSVTIGFLVQPKGPVTELMTSQLLLEFFAGECIGLWFIRGGRSDRAVSLAIFAATLALCVEYVLRGPATGERFIDRGVPAIGLVFSLLMLEGKIAFPRWLQKLGDSSYSLYLTHTFSVTAVYKLAEAAGLITSVPSDIVVLAAAAIAIFVAHFVHVIFERPMTRVLTAWWARRRKVVLVAP